MKNHLRIQVPLKMAPPAGNPGGGVSGRPAFAKEEAAGMASRANPSTLQIRVPFRDVAKIGGQGRKIGGLSLADKVNQPTTASIVPRTLQVRVPFGYIPKGGHPSRGLEGPRFATERNLALAVPVSQGDSSEPMDRSRPWPAKGYYEVGIESFFNARHYTQADGGVEGVHHHSWRVRLVLSVNSKEYSTHNLAYPNLKERVEKELAPFSNAILNNVFPFTEIEPTPENVASLLVRKFRAALEREGVALKSVTLWESPVYYVECSEDKS